MAGYSGTPLVKKLGIKEDHQVALLNAPPDFRATLEVIPAGVTFQEDLKAKSLLDVILFFVRTEKELAFGFLKAAKRLSPAGGLWVAWPKRASGVATDLTENVIRGIGLAAGLVDNKVCAVDDIWSGLRFVIRLKDRPKI